MLSTTSPGMRIMLPSLRIGAIGIWMLNALIYRPGEMRWDEKLVTTTAAYEMLDEDDDEETNS